MVDTLFRTFQLGSMHLRNRIAMAPMTREFCEGGVPGQEIADYYRRRAEGGVGLIVTEGTAINEVGARNNFVPRFFGEDALEGWRHVVNEVHEAGAAIVPQLWHIGIQQTNTVLNPKMVRSNTEMVGPSGLDGLGNRRNAPMTERQIEQTIEDFGKAAEAARRIGFDGIALHGAHGYLLDQFMWSFTNRRTDRYGGDIAARARFAAEVVAECRRRVGGDYPIIFRFSQWKVYDYEAKLAATPAELETLLRPLVDAGVDLFDCSTRRFHLPAFPASDRNLATWTKIVTGIPSMAVGSITLNMDVYGDAMGAGISAAETSLESLDAVCKGLRATNKTFCTV